MIGTEPTRLRSAAKSGARRWKRARRSEVVSALPSKDDIDRELLQKTQAYLLCRSQGLPPDRSLRKAWEQFYGSHVGLIRRFAVACGVPTSDLDDCVQQVLADLIRRLPGFRHDPERARLRTWLYVLVRSRAADLHRYRLRHPTERLSEAAAAKLCARDGDPAAAYEQQRRRAAVQRVLAALNRRASLVDYCVLHMRCIEDRTVAEIALVLGLTPAQVSRRSYRMKQEFRRLLKLYTTEEDAWNG